MRNEREGRLGGLRTLFTRQHDVVSAVEDVSFDIEPGELVGYLGPNGAGKSTTIKMLTGIMVPTSGTGEVAGLTPWKERERNALRGHTRRSRPRPVDPDRATSSGVRGGADRCPLMGGLAIPRPTPAECFRPPPHGAGCLSPAAGSALTWPDNAAPGRSQRFQ